MVPSSFITSQITPRRVEARDARQVDRGLGLTGALQNATLRGAQGEHVPRARQVAGNGRGIDGRLHSGAAVGGRDTGGNAAPGFDRYAEGRVVLRRVLRNHQRYFELIEPFAGHRQTDQPATVRGHEVDRFGGDLLGRDRQVAFVFAILVVDDDHEATGGEYLRQHPRSWQSSSVLTHYARPCRPGRHVR